MERLSYSISINAAPEKVWKTLFGNATFPIWKAPFAEGSSANGNWAEGSQISILNKNREGVVYLVEINEPFVHMSLKQIGIFKDGKKYLDVPEVLEFADGYENFHIDGAGGISVLRIEKDTNSVQRQFYDQALPDCLEIIKSLAEADDQC